MLKRLAYWWRVTRSRRPRCRAVLDSRWAHNVPRKTPKKLRCRLRRGHAGMHTGLYHRRSRLAGGDLQSVGWA